MEGNHIDLTMGFLCQSRYARPAFQRAVGELSIRQIDFQQSSKHPSFVAHNPPSLSGLFCDLGPQNTLHLYIYTVIRYTE